MTRSKHAIAREIEETREDLTASAKMAAVSLLLRNPVVIAAKTISGFMRRRRARKSQPEPAKSRVKMYRNLGIALGTGAVAGFAYRFWRRSRV